MVMSVMVREVRHMDEEKTNTTVRTLWTETILEMLYEALRGNGSDVQVKGILVEVTEKGMKRKYIIDKVREKVDDTAAVRVRALFG